ncbi:hypothetical protein HIM_02078 [Hirsutella minnesotensis 3608]|nr:hypothetical protein HIM_02078 [Hirsutella minnesotensis 3608]
MAFSYYDSIIVETKTALTTLSNLVSKAEKQPDPNRFLGARLCDDMKPFNFQVHAATRFSEKLLARHSGKESREFEDNLASYADMHQRISDVLGVLKDADKDEVNHYGAESAPTDLPSFGSVDLTGKAFAMGAVLPNINFHVCMAYAILRKEGVPLGKWDYIQAFVDEHITLPK